MHIGVLQGDNNHKRVLLFFLAPSLLVGYTADMTAQQRTAARGDELHPPAAAPADPSPSPRSRFLPELLPSPGQEQVPAPGAGSTTPGRSRFPPGARSSFLPGAGSSARISPADFPPKGTHYPITVTLYNIYNISRVDGTRITANRERETRGERTSALK